MLVGGCVVVVAGGGVLDVLPGMVRAWISTRFEEPSPSESLLSIAGEALAVACPVGAVAVERWDRGVAESTRIERCPRSSVEGVEIAEEPDFAEAGWAPASTKTAMKRPSIHEATTEGRGNRFAVSTRHSSAPPSIQSTTN